MFAQLQPGILELLMVPVGFLLVGGLLVGSAVWRVKKKLDPANKPSTWTYINELGGYFVLGILLLLGGLISFLNSLFGLF